MGMLPMFGSGFGRLLGAPPFTNRPPAGDDGFNPQTLVYQDNFTDTQDQALELHTSDSGHTYSADGSGVMRQSTAGKGLRTRNNSAQRDNTSFTGNYCSNVVEDLKANFVMNFIEAHTSDNINRSWVTFRIVDQSNQWEVYFDYTSAPSLGTGYLTVVEAGVASTAAFGALIDEGNQLNRGVYYPAKILCNGSLKELYYQDVLVCSTEYSHADGGLKIGYWGDKNGANQSTTLVDSVTFFSDDP